MGDAYSTYTLCRIEYQFVWVTKYRDNVLRAKVAERVRELVSQSRDAFEIRIVRRAQSKDCVGFFGE